MHINGKKTSHFGGLSAAVLAATSLLGACERPTEDEAAPQESKADVEPSCGSQGRLSTQLYGSIARQIRWNHKELRCESMLRPDGEGMRLRFTGDAAGSKLTIILAIPELQRGSASKEIPTVVTLTVEGSGRFFSTPTSESCWSDIAAQRPVEAGSDRYEVVGTLYCVAPLGEINGDGAVSIPALEFRSIIDWSPT